MLSFAAGFFFLSSFVCPRLVVSPEQSGHIGNTFVAELFGVLKGASFVQTQADCKVNLFEGKAPSKSGRLLYPTTLPQA